MGTDVITMITSDHRAIEALFERLNSRQGDPEADVAELAALLTAHARAEEDRVYAEVQPSEAHHGVEEHKEAEVLLDALKHATPGTPHFSETLVKLVESVKHHVEEEESEILPALRESLSQKQLEQLGKAFKERRESELLALRPPAPSKEELYKQAQEADIPGRSTMDKDELAEAVKKAKS
ncbi:hemerythrin domain-containing protein [Nonomuraea roseola]|uniref:Hemerythrin domain-containing protein n=1 Tax=Nonomuraea roseola TaxID=46179 RepID=A0ABV5Q774_9ACTN